MATATLQGGKLKPINETLCVIYIGDKKIVPKILPEITDTKRATYADTIVIGRSTPIKTYSHSDPRIITMKLHFIVIDPTVDLEQNLKDLNLLRSALYPRKGDPYAPPVVCKMYIGRLIYNICAVLESCNVQLPTNVVWDDETLIPFYFATDLVWHVVYTSDLTNENSLPNAGRILDTGT